jgi:hypothetical protein
VVGLEPTPVVDHDFTSSSGAVVAGDGAAFGGVQGAFAGTDEAAGLEPPPVAPHEAARSSADMRAEAVLAGGAGAGVDPPPVAPHDAADMGADAVVAGANPGADVAAAQGVGASPMAWSAVAGACPVVSIAF